MGCDVHPVIQVCDSYWDNRIIPNWDNRIIPNDDRAYLFFGTLAGVRDNSLRPIFPPRGYPSDMSTPKEEWGVPEEIEGVVGGEHTASWFTLEEAKDYRENYLDVLAPSQLTPLGIDGDTFASLCNKWASWIEDMEYAKKFFWDKDRVTDSNIRVVFNFDS